MVFVCTAMVMERIGISGGNGECAAVFFPRSINDSVRPVSNVVLLLCQTKLNLTRQWHDYGNGSGFKRRL